jgi:uncharacterized protein RhaS with RHS repeats
MYHPTVGRFMQRDPIGYAAGMGLYEYVGNVPTRSRDPFGTFDKGKNAGGDHLGHSDFPGNDVFGYNLEDTDPETGPHTAKGVAGPAKHHFRDMEDIEADMEQAVSECNQNQFQREAHNGQDWFSHRKGLGYPDRTPEGNRMSNARKAQLKHASKGVAPDDTTKPKVRGLWGEAAEWTKEWMNKWYDNCCRYKGKWTPKAKVPGGPQCCDKGPLDAAGGLAA